MKLRMFSRSGKKFLPFRCKISKIKGRDYIIWGRFRIRLHGDPHEQVFEDQYEIDDVSVTLRSRNDIVMSYSEDNKTAHEYLLAVHLILPEGFKGKCIQAANGKRVFYDYRKKGDSSTGFFSVVGFIHIPKNEVVSVLDTVDGELYKTVIGNIDAELSIMSNHKA